MLVIQESSREFWPIRATEGKKGIGPVPSQWGMPVPKTTLFRVNSRWCTDGWMEVINFICVHADIRARKCCLSRARMNSAWQLLANWIHHAVLSMILNYPYECHLKPRKWVTEIQTKLAMSVARLHIQALPSSSRQISSKAHKEIRNAFNCNILSV